MGTQLPGNVGSAVTPQTGHSGGIDAKDTNRKGISMHARKNAVITHEYTIFLNVPGCIHFMISEKFAASDWLCTLPVFRLNFHFEMDYLNSHINIFDPDTVAVYDELPLWSAMFGLMLLHYVPLKPNIKALDVGCGTGFPLIELAQRLGPGSIVHGIDPWEPAIEKAKQKIRVRNVENVELHVGDAVKMPFADGEMDLIVSNLGVNNFADPEAAIRECSRVLKPSGILALTTNLQGHMAEFYEVYESTLRQLCKEDDVPALQAHIAHRASISRVVDLLKLAGLSVRQVQQETRAMRFATGSAIFHHYFIQLGFLDGWKGVLNAAEQQAVFMELEANLNRLALQKGDLSLSIPMAYIEAAK